MFKSLAKFPEWRVVGFLAIIALSWHIISLLGAFLSYVSDIFAIVILSWIIALILEPFVHYLMKKDLSRIASALVVYLLSAAVIVVSLWIILPQTVSQLSELSISLPRSLPQNSFLTPRIESFIADSLANSVSIASGAASAATGFILIFIISFYFLLSRKEISNFLLKVIPDRFEEDYLFLEKTINESFATFIRVQFFIGLTIGLITYLTLVILKVDYALSTSIAAAVMAMIPVIGAVLAVFPPVISALVVSVNTAAIAGTIIIIASQLVYNILAPKLLGNAFKIHPVTILLSFVVGYKLAGVWGSIFSIPIVGAFSVILKDMLKYWREEADK